MTRFLLKPTSVDTHTGLAATKARLIRVIFGGSSMTRIGGKYHL